MAWFEFVWTQETIDHIKEHGLTIDEVESVVCYPDATGASHSSGRPTAEGFT